MSNTMERKSKIPVIALVCLGLFIFFLFHILLAVIHGRDGNRP